MTDKSPCLSRRAFLVGAGAVVTTLLTPTLEARTCDLDFICFDPEDGPKSQPAQPQKTTFLDKLARREKPNSPPSLTGEAFQYYDAIGRAVAQGHYVGHIRQLNLELIDVSPDNIEKLQIQPPEGHTGPWAFDFKALQRACRCKDKDQTLPPSEYFEKHKYYLLGMMLVMSHDTTPKTETSSTFKIMSAYRTQTYNDNVGGAPNSRHLYCFAIDHIGCGIADYKMATAALHYCEAGKGKTTCVPYTNNNFGHIDARSNPQSSWAGAGSLTITEQELRQWQRSHGIIPFQQQHCIKTVGQEIPNFEKLSRAVTECSPHLPSPSGNGTPASTTILNAPTAENFRRCLERFVGSLTIEGR